VAARTRLANRRIADRFTRLAHDQIEQMCRWLDQQAPPMRTLDELEEMAAGLGADGNAER
jgi:hypothetical protein